MLAALVKETTVAQRARDVFAHCCVAPELWMRRIHGETVGKDDWWPPFDAATLPALIDKCEREWVEYLNSLPDPVASHKVGMLSFKGDPIEFFATDILTQFHNHSCYHRGQIAVMFREAGIEPIYTDFIIWARTVEKS